jgi:hypothetical protein
MLLFTSIIHFHCSSKTRESSTTKTKTHVSGFALAHCHKLAHLKSMRYVVVFKAASLITMPHYTLHEVLRTFSTFHWPESPGIGSWWDEISLTHRDQP